MLMLKLELTRSAIEIRLKTLCVFEGMGSTFLHIKYSLQVDRL